MKSIQYSRKGGNAISMLSETQKLSLLSLHSREICQRLQYIDESRATSLLELVEKGIVERLRTEFPDKAVGTELWRELLASPMKNKLYDSLLAYFHEVEDELRDNLSFVDRRSQFNVVLEHLDDFMKTMDTPKCLEYLKSIKQYKDVVTSITENCDETDDDHRKKVILRTIPCLGRSAVYDIMFSIQETSKEGFDFVEKIHPNFLRYYELLKKERTNTRGLIRYWPEEGDLSTFLENKSEADGAQYIEVDLNFDDLPESRGVKRRLLSCINNRTFKETPLYLRDYQKELCEAAKAGDNCIVSAPTGSGKTIVAASIIKHHLSTHTENAKVLFLVSNTAIINQQANCMAKFLEHRYEVDRICGMDNKPIKEMIRASDVLVCTPQLIVNQISGKNQIDAPGSFDCPTEPFRLDVFTLIVFDECHNTKKSSPYSVLMQHYHRAKSTGIYKKGPQIVGLTASLGVGNATKSLKDAMKHIVGLCALLDCKTISVVRKYRDELRQFSPPTADEFDFCGDIVEQEKERNSFLWVMFAAMRELEDKINGIFDEAHVSVASPSNSSEDLEGLNERVGPPQYNNITKAPQDKGSMDYLSWVSCHLKKLIPESPMDDKQKRRVTEIFEMLHMLFRALELCDDFTTRTSFEYLEEKYGEKKNYLSRDTSQIIEKALAQLKPNCTDKCVMVTTVQKHLLSQHAAAGNSRSIIFVRTRNGAKILSSLLNSLPALKEAKIASEPLFGINANDDGSNKRDQAEKLAKFASGETRVLVSTSVAEEGLDIAQCNLVIKYNYSTNEIAHVQRRGRGRAKGSRCILVTNSERLRKQEEGNVMKEWLMKEAMDHIERRTFDLTSMVEREIKKLREEILTADLKEADKVASQKKSGVVYELQCRNCSAVLCTNAHIKCNETQFCVTDPTFWRKVEAKPVSAEKQKGSKFGAVGEFFCNATNSEGRKCGRGLGRVIQISNGCIPVIAAESFTLVFERNGVKERKTVPKWKRVVEQYFTPEVLRTHDLAKMQEGSSFAPVFSGNI